MVIRCEHCSTTYELDEALLSPAGSPVQCTRCQHVFTAFPPGAGERKLVGVSAPGPAPDLGPAEAPLPPEPAKSAPGARRVASAGASASAAPARAEPTRPAPRSGPPPVYRPSSPVQGHVAAGNAAVGRSPLLRRDTVGTFEARLRWSARLKWLVPAAAALVVAAIAAGAWLLRSRGPDPAAARARDEAMSLVARDDAASLERALVHLDEAVRRAPGLRGAEADRALAQVVRAASLREGGDERRSRALAAEAHEALRKLGGAEGGAPGVERGLAVYHALEGDRARAVEAVRAGREHAPADPWLDLAEAWADAREQDQEARERALVELGALSTAHPELLRARYLLARTQSGLGRREEALATLDALVAANPAHEAGKRLRTELSAPPAPLAPSPQVLPAEKAAAPGRNVASPPPLPPAGAAPTPVAPPPPRPRPAAATPAVVVPAVPIAPVPPATVEPEAPAAVEPAPAPPAPEPATGAGADAPTPPPERRRRPANEAETSSSSYGG